MKPDEKQIKEIAEELELGMLCFYNQKTGKIISYPSEMDDEDLWEKDVNEVDQNSGMPFCGRRCEQRDTEGGL
ncbi:MAG: hypothetical protein PF692_00555 [Kiritimatiellae bacterium]|jgi:hypothetical protein|nr:hypothetical protein [Kiritimatiellia bacterium]